ncbi:2'-5' RNA ligase [Catellatospora sp. TT07R-123]|uniref:2'-5' RNA ligase family protein n=1 Tax=Catellatospora sp. TT07R-123 TaxID=2733863 RepID=UPI001B040D95|nr:2'-5' RNA ligase family protein [Catellatospora sp. TT07R-123]GHJ48660.1 2'-5' RNA ligase [Catellatospora sp. TT07R-123]
MTAALELYFDQATTFRLRRLWDALEAEGIPSLRDLTHRKHRPHLSITSAEVLDGPAVQEALGDLPAAPPLKLTFDHIGQFLGRVLWLGPVPTRELLDHQAAVHARLAAAGIETGSFYQPGSWVPHCTLSMRVPLVRMTDAIRLCLDVLPVEATFTGAAVADHARDQYHRLPS